MLFQDVSIRAVDSGTFWLSETPERPGSKSWDSSLPRIATWVRLRDRATGDREICFLNTHWDHRGNQARVEIGKLIRGWLAEHAAGMPTIVTGDLNVTDETMPATARWSAEEPDDLRLRRRLSRTFTPKPQPDEATFHDFTGKRDGRRIDFIFASPEFTASEATIDTANHDGRYPSDHFPVTAVLMS